MVLSDGSRLPLRLLLSTSPPQGAPIFGRFWWCPLLESTLRKEKEGAYVLSTLGGRHVRLVEKPGKKGELASEDGKWTGTVGRPGTLAVVRSQAWEYTYRRGRIVKAQREGGAALEWQYEGGRPESIRDAKSGEVVGLSYASQSTLPAYLTINGTSHRLEKQNVPLVGGLGGQVVITGFDSSLLSVGEAWKFPIVLSRDGTYTMAFTFPPDYSRVYKWDGKSGILQSDGLWDYTVAAMFDGTPRLSRTKADGGFESYFYNENTGESEHQWPDGTIEKCTYFLGEGPIHRKIRDKVTLQDGKEISSTRWSYDDEGRVLRESKDGLETIFTWHANGKPASKTQTAGDSVLLEENYDDQGRIIRKQKKSHIFEYAYQGRKVIAQRIQDGKVALVWVSNPDGSDRYFFAKDSGNGQLKVAQGLVSPSGNQGVEMARALAQQAMRQLKTN